MNFPARLRRDAAREAGRIRAARGFSLAAVVLITTFLALLTILVALSVRREREQRMVATARTELSSLIRGIESFRATEYRLPDSLEELRAAGWSGSPAVTICAFLRRPDPRQFDDHIVIVLHHRASQRGLAARYPPAGGEPSEVDATEACHTHAAAAAAMDGGQP